jgi:Cu-processing system permease protein
MMRITKYVVYDILKGRVMIAYTLLLAAISFALFSLDDDSGKAVLSLLNIILIVVPLISMVFTTIHYYNSYEFIEMMLSQPVGRATILFSEYTGTALSLILGVGIPVVLYQFNATGIALIVNGCLLTLVSCSIAFVASVRSRDKARGIGLVLLLWFYFALLYDGLVLMILFAFNDYPLERFTILLSALNPIDLARISMMLKLDISALMGYTGAVYKDFFGSAFGNIFTTTVMLLWIALPLIWATRIFRRKDM